MFYLIFLSTRPRYEEAASSASIAVKNHPASRVSRMSRPGTSGITNGRSHSTTDDDTDVDVTDSPKTKNKFIRTRPVRGIIFLCLCFNTYSGIENNLGFPS